MNKSLENIRSSDYVRRIENTLSKLQDEISVYKQLEAENAKSISFLNGILDQALAGIYVFDSNGLFSYVNQVFADIFGYLSPEEIVGKVEMQKLVAPECRNLALENLKKRTSGQVKEIRYTFTGLRKDGTRNTVEVHGCSMTIGSERFIIGLIIDMTDYQRMSELAFYDSLTNLPNRALFNDRLSQVIAHAQRNQGSFTIFYIDLDGFKEVNDTYGHAAGDHVLKESAERLQSQFRNTDTVSRLGGDEFVVIFTGSNDRKVVEKSALKILNNLKRPVNYQEHVLTVGASIGISMYPQNGVELKTLLQNADTAMYKAKKSGKRTYSLAG